MDRGISIAGVRRHAVNESTILFVRKNADKISRIINPSTPLRAKIFFVVCRDFLPEKLERAFCMAGGLR